MAAAAPVEEYLTMREPWLMALEFSPAEADALAGAPALYPGMDILLEVRGGSCQDEGGKGENYGETLHLSAVRLLFLSSSG